MTNPLTESRQAVAAVLEPLGLTVYAAPPASLTTPAAVMQADEPWAEPVTFTATRVGWSVLIAAGQLDGGEAAYERLEGLVWDITGALRAAGMAVTTITQPRSQKYGQAEIAVCDLGVRVLIDDQ